MIHINQIINSLPEKDKLLLDQAVVIRKYRKSEIVFSTLNIDYSILYVASGLIRKYILKEGKELTIDFYFSDDVYFPKQTTLNKQGDFYLEATEDSVLYQVKVETFEKIKAKSDALKALELMILDIAYTQIAERLESFQTMNATERYLNLIEKDPKIIQKIPLIYISTYLGINNASLSKIRASLR